MALRVRNLISFRRGNINEALGEAAGVPNGSRRRREYVPGRCVDPAASDAYDRVSLVWIR